MPLFACSLYAFANGGAARAVVGARTARRRSLRQPRRAARGRREPDRAHLDHHIDIKQHPFAALNSWFATDGAVVRAPRGVAFDNLLHLVFASVADATPRVTHPRVVVVAEAGSRVTIVQDHVSTGSGPGFTNAVTEVHVGPGATVHWVLLRREGDAHFQRPNLAVRQLARQCVQRAHAHARRTPVRNDARRGARGRGAPSALDGLFVGGGTSVLDNHTEVDHAVPHCTSRELYKGVLGGAARGVFRGRVIVRPDAARSSPRSRTRTCCSARAPRSTPSRSSRSTPTT